MKTYKHLFEETISDAAIDYAILTLGESGGKKKKRIEAYMKRYEDPYAYIQELCRNYKQPAHTPKIIYDGVSRKQRKIIVPTIEEQLIHHLITNSLIPIIHKSLYFHSYGSIPRKGPHKAKKFLQKWIRKDVKNTKYCLKLDIRKYFDSIPTDKLLETVKRKIKDEEFIKLLEEVLSVQEVGIPLGFYTSQWLANEYLSRLDHLIKEEWGAKYYVRYMDDMVILGPNKRKLHTIKKKIEKYLNEDLGLNLKGNWQLFRMVYFDKKRNKEVGRPLDFLGFKFYRNRTTLRRSVMLKMTRKANRMYKKKTYNIHDCRQFLAYYGWYKSCDMYSSYNVWVAPKVKVGTVKKYVADYDRKRREQENVENLSVQCKTAKDR